jgi:phage baseplate assembly protein W
MRDEREREIARRRVLGRGPLLQRIDPDDWGRDLVFAKRDGTGPRDLVFAEEADNLGQSLQVALTTALGSDPFNIAFGFDGINAIARETNPVLVRERVRIAVIQTLRRDPRVRAITDLHIDDDAPTRTLSVRVSFELVSGEQTTVELGRTVLGV